MCDCSQITYEVTALLPDQWQQSKEVNSENYSLQMWTVFKILENSKKYYI